MINTSLISETKVLIEINALLLCKSLRNESDKMMMSYERGKGSSNLLKRIKNENFKSCVTVIDAAHNKLLNS